MKNFSVKHVQNFKGARPAWSIVRASSRANLGFSLVMTHGSKINILKVREMNGRSLF